MDFSAIDGDKIDLRYIDVDPSVSGYESMTFIGTDAFHGVAGELRYSVWNGNALIQGDLTGNGVADFSIKLWGITSLSASDFIV